MRKHHFVLITSLFIFLSDPSLAQRSVVINRVVLSEVELGMLDQFYKATIPNGEYWYDTLSGLWGYAGGPVMGQMLPNLDLGGALQANASGGGSGVYFNGRELHYLEGAYLYSIFGVLIPGRYWLSADGWLGLEGGPASFNLFHAIQQRTNNQSRQGYTSRGAFGNTGSDGSCFYYNDPSSGSSYMPPGC